MLSETVGLGPIRHAFVRPAGHSILQRAVDDVAVAGDPSDVGGAPVSVLVLQVEHPLRGDVGPDRLPTGGVYDTLRLTGGSRRVQNVERMLGVQPLGSHWSESGRQLVPPVITAGLR